MPKIVLQEKITKEIEISMETLYQIVDQLNSSEKMTLLNRISEQNNHEFQTFKKENLDNIIDEFQNTELYEDEFLKDLEKGLKKSSVYS